MRERKFETSKPLMNTTEPTERPPASPPPTPIPYRDAPSARTYLTALGDIYREAGCRRSWP